MLKFYLTSVLIYAIIFYCECKMFGDNIRKNGWVAETKKNKGHLSVLFCIGAIPVVRFIFAVMFCVMFACTKEQYEAWLEEMKNESN